MLLSIIQTNYMWGHFNKHTHTIKGEIIRPLFCATPLPSFALATLEIKKKKKNTYTYFAKTFQKLTVEITQAGCMISLQLTESIPFPMYILLVNDIFYR